MLFALLKMSYNEFGEVEGILNLNAKEWHVVSFLSAL